MGFRAEEFYEKSTTAKTKSSAKNATSKVEAETNRANEFKVMNHPAMKYVLIAMMVVLVVTFVSIAHPFARAVDTPEKIDYALHADDLYIDRLEVTANGIKDAQDWKYLAVIENADVTMMVTVNAQQYMMLNEGDIVAGHLVVMTNGEGVFAFAGDENNCEVICYIRNK